MKKRVLYAITCVMITSVIALAGCGKKDTGSIADKLEDTKEETHDVKEKDKPEEKKEEEKTESRFSKDGESPVLLLHRGSQTEHNDQGQIAINHQYSFFTLDESYASSNKELDEAVLKIRDQILTIEKRSLKKEIDSLKEDDLYSYEENWDTYLRRADNNILSFVTEYVAVGQFDGQYYTEYTSHNFYTDTGEEIELSDVVKDEDAFYDLMASKLYEYFEYAKKNIYQIDAEGDVNDVKESVKGYLADGSCAWTLDPYGITFFLNAYTGLPEGVSATVLFSEDGDGKIFDPDFVSDARDEWVIQSPMHIGTYVDLDDDGDVEYFNAHLLTDLQEGEGSEYYYVSGLYISAGGGDKRFDTSMPGGTSYYTVYLSHKKGRSIVFEYHDEYDTGFITSYELGKEIREADAIRGDFELAEDASDTDYDIIIPQYVPLDTDKIRILKEEDNEARDMTPEILSIDEKGKMKLESGDFDHYVRSKEVGDPSVEIGYTLNPFYGVWVGSFKDREEAIGVCHKLEEAGFDESACIYSVEWEKLNKEPYYCVTAGMCVSEDEAQTVLGSVKKAGYKDAYVKFTGKRLSHRVYFIVYSEDSIEVSGDEVIIDNVQYEDLSGSFSGEASLIVDKDTVFDETCDPANFGNYADGETPLEWYKHNKELLDEDPDKYLEKGPALKGVFEVSVTGNHVDAFYGSYWWD
ncbi:MAG: SPOR domain-containing protein [Lachnospiraceae bacterium]|nr:SPOR domain-containing protein [Lachnospiraceae bacterium]